MDYRGRGGREQGLDRESEDLCSSLTLFILYDSGQVNFPHWVSVASCVN